MYFATMLWAASVGLGGDLDGGQQATHRSLQRGLKFLEATQQPDGGWAGRSASDPAITALVAQCFIQSPEYGPRHPLVERAVKFIQRYVQPDGSIGDPDQALPNYHTSVCLMALSALGDPAMAETIARAQASLKKGQWDEQESHDSSSTWYGGAGYGHSKRPDLSNTQMMLEALHQSNLPADDPVYQKALVFVSRCQMRSESNDQPYARGATDGGFIYSPVGAGESKAEIVRQDGVERLRTYGSMTYSGFKSLLYAGLSKSDPRVKAALEWIGRSYTLDENPNMPGARSHEGLFYYYYVFARALNAWNEDTVTDAAGRVHPWRAELCDKLRSLQRQDGSWVNDKDRWFESNPHLVTAYSVLAMQTAAR